MKLKKISIIVCAILIIALVLPFSAMDVAEAKSEKEKKKDKEKKKEKKSKKDKKIKKEKKTKKEKIKEMHDKGFKLYPGLGWVDTKKDKQKQIWKDHPNKQGKKILDLDKMLKQRIDEGKFDTPEGNYPHYYFPPYIFGNTGGWNIAAEKLQSKTMTKMITEWIVPNKPINNEGTIYYFNAFQPVRGAIFQPVLQYGFSDVCDAGDNWVTYPMIYVFGWVLVGDCIPAEVGDHIQGSIIKTRGVIWTISIENEQNPQATDKVRIGYSGNSPQAFVALETYNLPRDCKALSGDIEFTNISIEGDDTNWHTISNGHRWCGMELVVLDGGNTIQINNNN